MSESCTTSEWSWHRNIPIHPLIQAPPSLSFSLSLFPLNCTLTLFYWFLQRQRGWQNAFSALSVCLSHWSDHFFPPTAHGSGCGWTCAHRQDACCANEGADARGRASPGPRHGGKREGGGVVCYRNVSLRKKVESVKHLGPPIPRLSGPKNVVRTITRPTSVTANQIWQIFCQSGSEPRDFGLKHTLCIGSMDTWIISAMQSVCVVVLRNVSERNSQHRHMFRSQYTKHFLKLFRSLTAMAELWIEFFMELMIIMTNYSAQLYKHSAHLNFTNKLVHWPNPLFQSQSLH